MKRFFFPLMLLPQALLLADFGIQSQVELHAKYQNLDFDLNDCLVYARLEGARLFSSKWQLYTRLDLPYLWLWGKMTEFISIDEDGIVAIANSEEDEGQHPQKMKKKKTSFREQGFADLLIRAFFVTPPLGESRRTTIGFGSELIFPTAQKHDLGTGKYAARPLFGFKYDVPEIGWGSFVAFLIKYQFSFAGNKHRESFRILSLQPILTYVFAPSWTLGFSPEYQYNVKTRKWFVPLPINITKGFNEHFSMTLAYQKGLVTAFPVFRQEVELTLRYTF